MTQHSGKLWDIVNEGDSSDDEYSYIPKRERWIRVRNEYFEDYDEIDFITRFRLSKSTTLSVLTQIEPQLEFSSDRNFSISPINQLLCGLRYYATGCTQLSAADYGGFSASTANRIIHRVSEAVASLAPTYIRFPTSQEDITRTKLNFYEIARFPKVLGAMDCTHVKITSPGGPNAELFRNRKGYFSINVQAICNADLEFTDVVARWPGSVHDSHIFNNCSRKAFFEDGRYGDSVLVVDAGYSLKDYTMPPLDAAILREESLYNESQIRTRNPIERLFGVWKRRFPVLALGVNQEVPKILSTIIATAVLHNIARRAGEALPRDDPTLQLPMPWDALIQQGEMNNRREQQPVPHTHRRALIDNYFKSLL